MAARIDFAQLAAALLSAAERLVPAWLPEGQREGHEWRCGGLSGRAGSSMAVNLHTGIWADFATEDKGGDLIALYAAIHGLTQIEAARQAMTRYIKRGGKIWIRIFPHTPVTKKALGLKMGGGKGNPEYYVAKVKTGTVMFEMKGVSEEIAREAMRLAGHKLPVRVRFVKKEEA